MVAIQEKDGNINAYIGISSTGSGTFKRDYQEIFYHIISKHKHNYNFKINIIFRDLETHSDCERFSISLFGLARAAGCARQLEAAIKETFLEVTIY